MNAIDEKWRGEVDLGAGPKVRIKKGQGPSRRSCRYSMSLSVGREISRAFARQQDSSPGHDAPGICFSPAPHPLPLSHRPLATNLPQTGREKKRGCKESELKEEQARNKHNCFSLLPAGKPIVQQIILSFQNKQVLERKKKWASSPLTSLSSFI